MRIFEIYQLGKLSSFTVVEADSWHVEGGILQFLRKDKNAEDGLKAISVFNWNNIAGFREIENSLNQLTALEYACEAIEAMEGKTNDNT